MLDKLSPIRHNFRLFLSKFKSSSIIEEALVCYRQKLPDRIGVSWQREKDGYIVGKVIVEENGKENYFFTQGKNGKDFIENVNDALYSYYEIPAQYISYLGGLEKYNPPLEDLEKLNDKNVRKAFIGEVFGKKEIVNA